ncbi:hypothetical protein KY363_04025 [Candidatus Woesearchaeota archaeon]|nr:hypothetical protein [Candidatus Woesearchaeota archaeon]
MREETGTRSKGWSALVFGGFFILIGLLIALKAAGVVNISMWAGFSKIWPVGFILVGIALLLRARWAAFFLLLLTLLLGVLLVIDDSSSVFGSDADAREVVQTVPADGNVTSVRLELDYGAGDVSMVAGNSSLLLKNVAETTDLHDPVLTYDTKGSSAEIDISRSTPGFHFGTWQKSVWDMELSPDVVYDLKFDYGASDVNLDLSGLKVDSIDMDFGASDTVIRFSSHPTEVDIDAGASDIDFEFPEGASVRVEVDGGAVSKHLDGFRQESKTVYLSPDYDEDGPTIDISINAGASSVSSSFY